MGTARKYLEEDNSFVLVIPFYETTSSVRQISSRKVPDADRHIWDGSLAFIDSMKAYFSEIGLMTW